MILMMNKADRIMKNNKYTKTKQRISDHNTKPPSLSKRGDGVAVIYNHLIQSVTLGINFINLKYLSCISLSKMLMVPTFLPSLLPW